MFSNYLTVAVRGLLRNKLYSAINIFGLSVGLASCLLLLLFVRDELSYDAWLPDAERVFRVDTRFDIPGRNPLFAQSSPGPAMPALLKDFAEIEAAARFTQTRPVLQKGADIIYEQVLVADPAFFDVIQLPFVAGDRGTALREGAAIAISETAARKYFGTRPALGESLTLDGPWGKRDYRVTGVFKDLPGNTHLKADFIARINEADYEKRPWVLQSWTSVNTATYIKLKPGADIERLRKDMPAFEVRNIPDSNIGGRDFKTADFIQLSLNNVRDLHLYSKGVGMLKPNGDAAAVATFSAVALMILLIACINFTNLATARASLRAREVALRKVLGARREQLVVQFLGESVLLALIALIVALVIVQAALPSYGNFLGRTFELSILDGGLWLGMAGLVALVGIVGGIYPALYLSRFSPARILKANKSAATQGSGRLRSALVILQFAISIGLIVCTAVVYGQTEYMRNLDVGFNKEGLLAVRGVRREAAKQASDAIREQMARIPGVVDVTRSSEAPADSDENNNVIQIPGKVSAQPIVVGNSSVDVDFFKVMGIPIVAGRGFSPEFGRDNSGGTPEELMERGMNAVISRGALKFLGLTEPSQAVGMEVRISVGEGDRDDRTAPVTIVGVVEDVIYDNAKDQVRPMMYRYRPADFNYVYLRMNTADQLRIQQDAARVWRELVPSQPFAADFVEATLAAQYDGEDAQSRMFAAFAGLAIIIACLGLYGLASFTAERRTKEIGIRKVLGAGTGDIVRILAWDFSKPVLVANVIAWPLAWWLMRDWLDGFEARIALSPVPFLAAGGVALLIALATVALHTARVARANPIHALRYE